MGDCVTLIPEYGLIKNCFSRRPLFFGQLDVEAREVSDDGAATKILRM